MEQAAQKGRGCDCKGLLWGVARDLGFPEAASFHATFVHYDLKTRGGIPHILFREGMDALFDRTDEIKPGRILLLKIAGVPAHLAIASRNEGRAWHAQIAPNPFVKEASIRSLLKMFPLDTIYRWRE